MTCHIENNRVILSLKDHIVSAWPEHNFLFSVIQNKETAYDWIMNTYIQSYASHWIGYGFDDRRITFYPYGFHTNKANIYDLCPFISKYAVPRGFINDTYGAFTDFIIYAINKGFYISNILDQFFRRSMNGNTGFHHPNYIYGYDSDKQLIYLVDNFEYGIYSSKEVSFGDINSAYSLIDNAEYSSPFLICLFLYQVNEYDYIFDLNLLIDLLKDYLIPGKNMCYLHRFSTYIDRSSEIKALYFGLNCYHLLQGYLDDLQNINIEPKDLRPFAFLYDHKKLMALRVKYLIHKGYLTPDELLANEFDSLEQKCKITLNLFIKYSMTNDLKYIDKISKMIEDIKASDQKTMEVLVERLEKL